MKIGLEIISPPFFSWENAATPPTVLGNRTHHVGIHVMNDATFRDKLATLSAERAQDSKLKDRRPGSKPGPAIDAPSDAVGSLIRLSTLVLSDMEKHSTLAHPGGELLEAIRSAELTLSPADPVLLHARKVAAFAAAPVG